MTPPPAKPAEPPLPPRISRADLEPAGEPAVDGHELRVAASARDSLDLNARLRYAGDEIQGPR